MAIKRVHIYVSGRVQGVWFRATAQGIAIDENLTGWVRNLRDSRVEIVAEGEETGLQALVKWCHIGSDAAEVSDVDDTWSDPTFEFGAFLSGETA
ncbi:MAG: acylphosphatase [Psychrosphaera sp.]|nr:acylphosphatase [Psychrosphaera sp.]NQZ06285.1 acylphosphatase [Algicola sp.]